MLFLAKVETGVFGQVSAYVVAGLLGLVLLGYCGYLGINYKYFPQRYRGIRINTKTITLISLMAGASVAATVVVSFYFPITVLPQFRLWFESIMVIVGGILLGPIAGIISALTTEVILLFVIPSYFHIAFTLAAVAAALIAGLVSIGCSLRRRNRTWFLLGSSLFIAGLGAIMLFYVDRLGAKQNNRIKIFNGIFLTTAITKWLLGVLFGVCIVMIWSLELFNLWAKKTKLDTCLLMKAVIVSMLTSFISSTFLISWGESALLLNKGYSFLVVYHLVTAPGHMVVNIPVIYITTRIVRPLLKLDLVGL